MSDNGGYEQQARELVPIAAAPVTTHASQIPWQRALAVFLDSRADSPHTRRAYAKQIERAMATLDVDTLADLTGEALAAWRAGVTASALAPASQSQALAAMRSFLRFTGAFELHRLPADVVAQTLRAPRASTKKPYAILTEPELLRLLVAAAQPRESAIVHVMLGGGLRAADLVALDVGDLREDQHGALVLHVRLGKGRKDRLVPVRGGVGDALRMYLAATRRTLGGEGPLFLSNDRAARRPDRLSTRAVGYLLERLCSDAGIDAKRISPHSCRHTYAIRVLRSGGSIVSLQKLLGHASLATTQRYLDHLELDELRDAVPDLPAGEFCTSAHA